MTLNKEKENSNIKIKQMEKDYLRDIENLNIQKIVRKNFLTHSNSKINFLF